MISEKNVEKWVSALRSGEYSQAQGALQTKAGYCCLGVACKTFIPLNKQVVYDNQLYGKSLNDFDQPNSPQWLKDINYDFTKKTTISLISLNDGHNTAKTNDQIFTFDEIADLLQAVYIEKVLE